MTVRGLVVFGHPALVLDLRADLTRELRNLWQGDVHVIIDHHTGDDPVFTPAALLARFQPHFLYCVPPVGSFSRAAVGRQFGPAADRDVRQPLGRTGAALDVIDRAAERTRIMEFCVLL